MTKLLTVQDMVVEFPLGRRQVKRAVDGVSFAIRPGQTLGIVGESGSGKSTVANSILGLAPLTSGTVLFQGEAIGGDNPRGNRQVSDLQVVFQDPYSSLDPTKRVGYSIAEPLLALDRRRPAAEVTSAVAEMLERVGMPATAANRYPAQFSGGQRQRIAIARALIVKPKLVICDEVVSALDLSVQAQIINLLADLQQQFGLSYLFIGHDLGVVEHVSDQVLVLYRGRVMESGPAHAVHQQPEHPYTRALVASAPVHDPDSQRLRRQARQALRTVPTAPAPLGDSCPFTHRCPFAIEQCFQTRPEQLPTGAGGTAACHRIGDLTVTRELATEHAS